MTKIYTRTGDEGTTSLIGGQRVDKYDKRVEAYGTIDELGAFVALLGDLAREMKFDDIYEQLSRVATNLMKIGSLLAVGSGFDSDRLPHITDEDIEQLEQSIDTLSEGLPQMRCFTLPGGAKISSLCHVCRTVCRRAERRMLEVSATTKPVDAASLRYINRLSDWFYVLSRWSLQRLGIEERPWLG